MPLSLQYIKELAEAGINWQPLHVIDAFSLVCSLRIDACKKYLERVSRERMNAAGVNSISAATEEDFDAL
ncbi:MAG: hypothetical protein K2N23_04525 [Clostridia bacterium]|nr:hypothetical protein [Clostridia bacterium]